jgi:D-serine deaminase-like pyridoxal phosphate-dependent protein
MPSRATTIAAVLELDVAYRPFGALHVGARRSPVRTPDDLLRLARAARAMPGVSVHGIMAYEAHVAGLTDRNPFTPALNPLKRWLKRITVPAASDLRARAVAALRAEGFAITVVNGGGTGSLETTAAEDAVTEVTVGSAFLAPHLFDYFEGLDLEPACFFACDVVRASDRGLVTCLGGGYPASGEAGKDRLPLPWLPPGLALLDLEGAGEVQTPLSTRACPVPLALGDPVFFRHAKAGEVAERFNEFLLLQGEKVVGRAPTYRGEGRAFL